MLNRKTLTLTIEKRWFDLIKSGFKKEEYRENIGYWEKRLVGKDYTHVKFINGRSNRCPWFIKPLCFIKLGYGNPAWGAPTDRQVFILRLGKSTEYMVNQEKYEKETISRLQQRTPGLLEKEPERLHI